MRAAALLLLAAACGLEQPPTGAELAEQLEGVEWSATLYAGEGVECPRDDVACLPRAEIRVPLDDGRMAYLWFVERVDVPLSGGDWTVDHQGAITVSLPLASFEHWRAAFARGARLRVIGRRLQLDEAVP